MTREVYSVMTEETGLRDLPRYMRLLWLVEVGRIANPTYLVAVTGL